MLTISSELIYKLLKYLALSIVMFLMLKHNSHQITTQEIGVIIVITVISTYIIFENLSIILYLKHLIRNSPIQIKEDPMNSTSLPLTQPSIEPTIHIPNVQQPMKVESMTVTDAVNRTINKPIPQGEPVSSESVRVDGGGYDIKFTTDTQVEAVGSRQKDDVMSDEVKYYDLNSLPIEGINSGSFEAGYSFLPPDRWFPVPAHPPICVCEKRCPVMPSPTSGLPVDLKDWNQTRRITQPDNINTSYIKEKLNSGR
jgi:hypothetical protein